MTKLTVITATILLSISTAFGQTIEIGQDAKEIKQLIQWTTQQRTGYDTSGNSLGNNVTWDVKYNNGQITDVTQCYSNQYLIDFRVVANFCKHYIMEHGQLAYVLTQYEDFSTDQLNDFFNISYSDYKSGGLYFSEDYKHYSKIYLANNGYATVEWRKTKPNELPSNLKTKIESKLKAKQEEDAKRLKEEEERIQKGKEIKSKTYNLKEYDQTKYNSFVDNLRYSLIELLKSNSSFPDYNGIEHESQKYFRFKNLYSAQYKLVNYSRESVDYGYNVAAGSNDIKSENKYTLVSGNDNTCQFIKQASPSLPTISYEGYTVMTEASVDDISVNYVKGITTVKIKNGAVTYKKDLPPTDFQSIISEKLKNEPNGLYVVKYEVGQVMGDNFIKTEKTKKTNLVLQILSTTSTVLAFAGILLILKP
jgi:hypothetical protein